MSQFQILDGSGFGNQARVDANKSLHTFAIIRTEQLEEIKQAYAYNINTGDITLTDATITSVLYFKNNEDRDFICKLVVMGLGNSTGGSGDSKVTIYRNPTAGTIVTDAVAVDMKSNSNFGSNNTLTADAYKGDTADNDFTDGTAHIEIRESGVGRKPYPLEFVLPKGTSVGISYTPPASNTSQVINCALVGYLRDPNTDEN
jgi:hypothetical protein